MSNSPMNAHGPGPDFNRHRTENSPTAGQHPDSKSCVNSSTSRSLSRLMPRQRLLSSVPAYTDMLDQLDCNQYQSSHPSGPCPDVILFYQAPADDRDRIQGAMAADRCTSAPPGYRHRLRACFHFGECCPWRAALQHPDIDKHPSRYWFSKRRSGPLKEGVRCVRALSRLLDDCHRSGCAVDCA